MNDLRTGFHESEAVRSDVIAEIVSTLAGLRFGSLEIVVHDGKVTQIERRSKLRISGEPPDGKLT